jgi:hypothetical protein
MRSRALGCTTLLVCAFSLSSLAPAQTSGRQTNLELFRVLSRQIADSVVAELPHDIDTLTLTFAQTGESVPVQEQFLSALKTAGKRVFVDSAVAGLNALSIRLAPEMTVSYAQLTSGGLSGDPKIERTVKVTSDVRMVRAASREVVRSGSESQTVVDTLAESDIASVETQGYPATHATLPEGGVLDKLVEPIVIIGAVGTMIFLFFHVRS